MVCHHLKIIKPKAYFSRGLSYSIELFYLEKVVGLLSDLFGDADFDGVELLAQPLLDHPARPLHLLGKVLPRRRGRQLKDGLERLRLREVERGVKEYPRDAGSRHRGLQIIVNSTQVLEQMNHPVNHLPYCCWHPLWRGIRRGQRPPLGSWTFASGVCDAFALS